MKKLINLELKRPNEVFVLNFHVHFIDPPFNGFIILNIIITDYKGTI